MASIVADDDMGASANKKYKAHEARLIPGLSSKVFGFPNSIITKLKYVDTYILTSTTGSIARQDFRANSVYDCDSTGAGHQPMYRDTYASVYDQYVVIGSKITVEYCNVSTAANGVMVVGIHTDDDSSSTASLSNMLELNNTIYKQIGPTGSGHDSCVLTSTFEPLEFFGVDGKDDGAASTQVGANPSEEIIYQVFACNAPSNTSICEILVTLEYTVKFSELSTQSQN